MRLPAFEVILAAEWARRCARVPRHLYEPPSPEAVRLALDEASNEPPDDQPAATFYALARRPSGIKTAWRLMLALLAKRHANRCGFELLASNDELDALRLAIVVQRLPYEHVRDWFRERLRPL